MTDSIKNLNLYSGGVLFLLFCILTINVFNWIIDDLYIYFRYVHNFTQGNGIVFNKGEFVEGFSSFSWLMILSLIKSAGLPLEFSAKFTGLIFTFFSLICVYRICNETGLSVYFIPSVILMLFNLPFILWAVSGFEIMMFIYLLLLCFQFIVRMNSDSSFSLLLSFLIFLLSVSRPEGIVFSVTMLIFIYAFSGNRMLTLKYLGIYSILFGAFLFFRVFYFGDILPNTYYAKIGHNIVGYYEFRTYKNGIFYILFFLKSNPQFLIFFLLLPFAFSKLKSDKKFLFVVSIISVQFAFIIFSGGDWMVQYRFAVVSIPFLSLGTVYCISRLTISKVSRPAFIKLFTLLIFSVSVTGLYLADRTVIKKETVMWNNLKKESADIYKYILPGSIAANGSSGIIPYYLEDVKFIDLVGLTNKHIAKEGFRHGTWFERSLPDYVYSLNPEWIIMWKKKNADGVYTFRDASPCYFDMAENKNFSGFEFFKEYDLYDDVKIELYKKIKPN